MSWPEELPLDNYMLYSPSFPDGGEIAVQFKCPKCGKVIEVEGVEIPSYGIGETQAESTTYGDTDNIECEECSESYDISAWNSIAGWYIEIDNENGHEPDKVKFKTIRYSGEDE